MADQTVDVLFFCKVIIGAGPAVSGVTLATGFVYQSVFPPLDRGTEGVDHIGFTVLFLALLQPLDVVGGAGPRPVGGLHEAGSFFLVAFNADLSNFRPAFERPFNEFRVIRSRNGLDCNQNQFGDQKGYHPSAIFHNLLLSNSDSARLLENQIIARNTALYVFMNIFSLNN